MSEDRNEGDPGDEERDGCIEEEVECVITGVNGIAYESEECSGQAVEADGEGEGKCTVGGEVSDAENKAYSIEPTDAATAQQTQQKYLYNVEKLSSSKTKMFSHFVQN